MGVIPEKNIPDPEEFVEIHQFIFLFGAGLVAI